MTAHILNAKLASKFSDFVQVISELCLSQNKGLFYAVLLSAHRPFPTLLPCCYPIQYLAFPDFLALFEAEDFTNSFPCFISSENPFVKPAQAREAALCQCVPFLTGSSGMKWERAQQSRCSQVSRNQVGSRAHRRDGEQLPGLGAAFHSGR